MSPEEIITTVVECIVLVVFFLIGKVIIPSIKKSSANSALEVLKDFVTTYVRGVEQSIDTEGAGDEKLAMVTKLVSEKATELGVSISEEDVRMLIESAVLALNEGQKTTTTVKVEK